MSRRIEKLVTESKRGWCEELCSCPLRGGKIAQGGRGFAEETW